MPNSSAGSISSQPRRKKATTANEDEQPQEALNEAAGLLAKAEQMAHLGSWQMDITTKRVIWSNELFRIFGLQPQPHGLSIKEYRKFIHPDDRDFVAKIMTQLFSSGSLNDMVSMDYRIILSDSTVHMIHSERAVKEVTKEGKPKIIVGIEQDITERKKAEEALYRNREMLVSIINSSSSIILARDLEGKLILLNDQLAKLYKMPKDKALGKTLYDIYPKKIADEIAFWDKKVMKEGKPASYEEIVPIDNVPHIYVSNKFPLRDSQGKIYGVGGVITDITERKQIELELEQYSKHLEKLVDERTKQLKNQERMAAIGETAGMVGHDLRNPLQSIIGEVYLAESELKLLPEGNQKSNLQESVGVIAEQVSYMDKIVSDLQTFVKPVQAHRQTVDLKPFITARLAEISLPKKIKTRIRIDNERLAVETDPQLLKRVLINLLTNAVQAMPDGGELAVNAESINYGQVQIVIEDTGVGIADEIKPKIFTPLFTTKAKGQGFGLAVCKRVIEAQGGTISFESQQGKGTKFTVSLPLKK